MATPPDLPEDSRDREHLKTLEICHYIMAGLNALGGLFLIGHFFVMQMAFGMIGEFPRPSEMIPDQEPLEEKVPVEENNSGPLASDPERQELRERLQEFRDEETRQEQEEEKVREAADRIFAGMTGVFQGLIFFYLIVGFLVLFATVLNFLSARYLAKRRKKTFSIVVAALNCLSLPLGTILGVFTIVVLSRPSVEAIYQKNR